MEFVLIIFIVIIAIVAAVLLVAFYYLRKGYRFIRRVANGDITEEEFERLSKKHYKGRGDNGINFDADYFKTTNKKQKQQGQQRTASRTFRTADGVTITDQRDPNQNKKIFAQDEGEYVDFKEVR